MRKYIVLGLLLSFNFAFAEVNNNSDQDRDSSDKSEKSYDASIKGLKSLMRDVKEEDPKIHKQLLPEYTRIKRKADLAKWIGIGGLTGGVVLSVLAIRDFGKHSDLDDENFGDTGNSMLYFLSAMGVLGASSVAAWVIAPERQEIKDLTNKYNQLSKKGRIKWSGFNVDPQNRVVAANFRF